MAFTNYDLIRAIDTSDMTLFKAILRDRDALGRPMVDINHLNDAGLSALMYIAQHRSDHRLYTEKPVDPRIMVSMFRSLLALRDREGNPVADINACYKGVHLVSAMSTGICVLNRYAGKSLLRKVLHSWHNHQYRVNFDNHVGRPILFDLMSFRDIDLVSFVLDLKRTYRGRQSPAINVHHVDYVSGGPRNWGTAFDEAMRLASSYPLASDESYMMRCIAGAIRHSSGRPFDDDMDSLVVHSDTHFARLRFAQLQLQRAHAEEVEARMWAAAPPAPVVPVLAARTWTQFWREVTCRDAQVEAPVVAPVAVMAPVALPGIDGIVDIVDVALVSLGFSPVDARTDPRARAHELAMVDEAVTAERYLSELVAPITLGALNERVALLDSGHILTRGTIARLLNRGNPFTRGPLNYRDFTSTDVDLAFLNQILNMPVQQNPACREVNLRSMKAAPLAALLGQHQPALHQADLLNLSKLDPAYINEIQLRGLLAIPGLMIDDHLVALINAAHAALPADSPVPLLSQAYLDGLRVSVRAADVVAPAQTPVRAILDDVAASASSTSSASHDAV